VSNAELEVALKGFASDYPVLRVMCKLAAASPYFEFDRSGVASSYGNGAPRTLKRFCDAGLIEKDTRPTGSGGRIYYTMPRHEEIKAIVGA
jgi:hypothetical protein